MPPMGQIPQAPVAEVVIRKGENGFIVVVGGGQKIYIAESFGGACEIVDKILNK